ncbi:MAG: hypothetical protein ABIW49_12540 [Knoellia sp.]
MNRPRVTRLLTIGLGILYVAAGLAETVRLTRSGDGGLAFWFGTLVGGGSLVLAGLYIQGSGHHRRGDIMLIVGAVAGMLATMWTLVVPVLALVVIWLTLTAPKEPATTPTNSVTGTS